MKITGVQPCVGKKVVIIRKLLFEPLQMDAKSVLSGDVVHAQEVVNSLVRPHSGQLLNTYSKILPANVPLKVFFIITFEFAKHINRHRL